MLRSILAASSILLSWMAGGGELLAQTAGSTPFDWSTLIGGALGSSPAAAVLAWRLNKADKELSGARAEIKALHERTITVAAETAGLLAEASRTLSAVQSGMEAQIARSRPEPQDRAEWFARMERAIEELSRRGRAP